MARVTKRKLASWYLSLARALEAGIALPDAIERSPGVPAAQRRKLSAPLRAGQPWDAALDQAPAWLPQTDRWTLAAAGVAGRLPETLRRLATMRQAESAAAIKAAVAMAYPTFVLHFAILVVPLRLLFTESAGAYLRTVGSLLLPLWAVLALTWIVLRARPELRRMILLSAPGLRGFLRARELAVFAGSLEALLNAGVGIGEGWYAASVATGSRAWRDLGMRMASRVSAGQRPGDWIESEPLIPEQFAAAYRNGEETGQLESVLKALELEARDRSDARLAAAAFWYPKLLFLAVALWVAWQVIGFYRGYIDQLEGLM
jgi:type II secretory pathway component PulF